MTPPGGARAGRTLRGRALLSALLASAVLAAGVLVSCTGGKKELSVVWTQDILTLDPNARFEFATDMYAMNVFEPLLRYDRRMSFAPALATRWDIADGKTWRFKLRPRVAFHDGTPMTADDVVFTFDRILANESSELAPYLAAVSSVRKVDNETVEIISDRPAGLLSVLSFVYILPKDTLTRMGDKAFFTKPIGTGPYRFVEWTPNKSLTLEASPTYWAGAPAFTNVKLHCVPDGDTVWKVARENRPAILMSPSRSSWETHKDDSSFRLVTRPGMTVQYLVCNLAKAADAPLADLRVRQAVHAAIDYPTLVAEATGGQAFPASQYVTPDVVGYDPTLRVPAFTAGLSQKLLAEAGYPQGIDVTMAYAPGSSLLPKAVAAQLTKGGIRVKEILLEGSEFFDHLTRCDADLYLTGWICSTGDSSELFEGNFYGKSPRKLGGPQGCGYSRPELDELLDTIARTLDAEERRNLLQKAMRTVVSDLPWIPLTSSHDRYALTGDVTFDPRPDGEIAFVDVKPR